ncbi:hypothetical protein [Streptomyces sp. NBC_01506]|uniref:hypothetical protein n=1 Tax=Streptomyces sp. NBC_01506 TaxID=2903887 RepID=UPI00386E5E04
MRRITTVLGAAAVLSSFAVSAANAAGSGPESGGLITPVNPVSELDAVATTGIPAEHHAELPKVKHQLAGLSHLRDLNQLHQLTDLGAPVLNLLPAVG